MDELGMSKTAIWVAAARAIGAREADASVRNPDHLAEPLLGDPAQLVLQHPVVDALGIGYDEAMQNTEVADTVRAMIERTRFIDDVLERAIASGVTQVLIPGAGLDSHAYRFSEMLTPVTVFEVDRPAMLEFKRGRVDEALGGPPSNVRYVPIDVQDQEMSDVLRQHGYDISKRTLVILEGVTMYVPEDAVRRLFQFVASHAPGSGIVFDFASSAIVESIRAIDPVSIPPVARPPVERLLNMLKDEPWVFGFALGGETEFLAGVGLHADEVLTLDSDESVRRYLTRADGTVVGAETHAKSEAMRKAALLHSATGMSAEERVAIEERMQEQRRQMAYRIAEASVPGH